MHNKPVLRMPVTVTLQHVEEPDMEQIRRTTGGDRMMKKSNSPTTDHATGSV
jgi:hypothetical protein